MAKLLQMLLFEEPEIRSKPMEATAFTGTADAAERNAALDIARSCIVEAPAGSGKTGLLIQRFLKLLAQGGVQQPGEVLAITFTRKADAEMRRRILEQLTAAAAGRALPPRSGLFEQETRRLAEAVLDRDRHLGWHLLESPQQLNIRTIDSFCAQLAGSLPLLSGAAAGLKPTEDADLLYELAAEKTLGYLGGSDQILTKDLEWLLLHRDAQVGDAVRLLANMLKQREQWGALLPLDASLLTDDMLQSEVLPRLQRTLQRLIEEELAAAVALAGPELLASAELAAQSLSSLGAGTGEPSPLESFAAASSLAAHVEDLPRWVALTTVVLTGGGTWRRKIQRNTLGPDLSAPQQQQVRDLLEAFRAREALHPGLLQALCDLRALPEATFPEAQWRAVRSLCRILRQGLIELQLVFAERRSCDFTEIALVARSLLDSDAALADLLSTPLGRLRHLLVDEMQDTSAGQYEIFEALTAGWDGSTQTVFLVGDPKQSIYEFRQARVERFLRVMAEQRFGQVPLQSLRLTANFRSQANLVMSFNEVFSQILPTPEALAGRRGSSDVPFVQATATRFGSSAPALQWHIAEEGGGSEAREVAEGAEEDIATPETDIAQARQARRIVDDFLASWPSRPDAGLRRPTVAVLARNRSHLGPILQEFQQDRGHGPLHYRAVDIESLAERPEILDLLSLTRALLYSADRSAWLAVLRSPLCGLSLSDLLLLVGEDDPENRLVSVPDLISSRQAALSPVGQQLLARCWPVLRSALSGVGRTAFSVHVERTWRSLGGPSPLKPYERANARRFFSLLQRAEASQHSISLDLLERRLDRLYAEPASADCPVELMTIHKAKGLQWDLVLVPGLDRKPRNNDPGLLQWLEFEQAGTAGDFLVAPIQEKGESNTQLRSWMGKQQRQRETAEAKRLLYVACTRAKEELHLFGAVKEKDDGSFCQPMATSLLAAAWPAVESVLHTRRRSDHATAEVIQFRSGEVEPQVGLALAAGATEPQQVVQQPKRPRPAAPSRHLPLAIDPREQLASGSPLLSYPKAADLRREEVFERPEGSFAARAFGNTVHRFLDLVAQHLATGRHPEELRIEIGTWKNRVQTVLRSEGIARSQVMVEAGRVQAALDGVLQDPEGRWLLLPHTAARNESSPGVSGTAFGRSNLRADRMFFAPPGPGESSSEEHLWILDYKTAEAGGRQRNSFLAEQKAKYLPQMEAYAEAAITAGQDPERIVLALYFPLLPALLTWKAVQKLP